MPRRTRLMLPNLPLHVIQRGNNRQACFFASEDYHATCGGWARVHGKPGALPTLRES